MTPALGKASLPSDAQRRLYAERRAYTAAHRILAEVTDYGQRELACPGAIRTRRIDMIAAVILEEFET